MIPPMPSHRPFTRFALLAIALPLGLAACAPQIGDVHPGDTRSPADTLHFPAPDRPISTIVAARWSDEDARDSYREAANVISLARIGGGMTVADIGAGDGYYVSRLSPAVGASGTVIGEDIIPQYLDLLRARVASEKLANVKVVLGTPDDPKLAAVSVDVAVLIHMYHEITRPFELLWNLSVAMKPRGTVAILDMDRRTDSHGTPPALLECELAALGFEQISRRALDDGAYVALFRSPAAPLAPAAVRDNLTSRPCAHAR
jgi:SAM-dependent methyltransferase